jgi:hypothetical protein
LSKSIDVASAKSLVLDQLAAGLKVADAMRKARRSVETYRSWRKEDPEFRAAVDSLRQALENGTRAKQKVPDFPEFCEKYVKKALPFHHLRAWDVVEGREPRDLRDGMRFQRGATEAGDNTKQVIINFPPDHAKSTVWNVQYALWNIVKNPDIRIAIVSKSQTMAKKFLGQIKFYLSNPSLFPELHAAFAPEGGWKSEDKSDGLSWRENMIYIRGREQAEKDPTVEALGVGGSIYGARFDLIILDDIEDFSTAGAYEQHANWIGQDVYSRLDKSHGQLLILGTRVGAMDIYRWLRDEAKTEDDEPTYTYFSQPAILENPLSHSSEWEVLWPERMPPRAIAKAKSAMTDQRRFTFVYQQDDVSEHAVFPPEAVMASVNTKRFSCPMQPGVPGHRERGMDGLYVIGAWDPASSAGRNAMIVYAVDKQTKRRWVLDVYNRKGVTSRHTIPQLKAWQVKYQIHEWRIEKNAVQEFISQLPEIREFVNANGGRITEHETRGNKFDPSQGVEGTLVPLFLSCVEEIQDRMVAKPNGQGLIDLPSRNQNQAVKDLTEQLTAWEPNNKKIVQDLVMALWFAELGARAYLRGGQGEDTHMDSRWTTRGARKQRVVIPWEEALRRGMVEHVAV